MENNFAKTLVCKSACAVLTYKIIATAKKEKSVLV